MEDIEVFVPEFEYTEKERLWYLSFVFFALLFILFGMLANNGTFIAIIILGSVMLLTRSRTKPKLVPFAINDHGIYFKNKFWEYESIQNFALPEIAGVNYLVFNTTGRIQSSVKIPMKRPDIVNLKLNNFLTKVEYQESSIENLIRVLGL